MFKELNKEIAKTSIKSIPQAQPKLERPIGEKKAAPLINTLSRPRPKALVRAIKDLDLLCDSDAEVKKRLDENAKWAKADTGDSNAHAEKDMEPKASSVPSVSEIGTHEFERQKQALLDYIRSTISRTVQHMPDELIGILADCGLKGCYTHLIDKSGYILKHFANGEPLEGRLETGYSEMKKHDGVSHIEVYAFHICVIDNYGQSKTISI